MGTVSRGGSGQGSKTAEMGEKRWARGVEMEGRVAGQKVYLGSVVRVMDSRSIPSLKWVELKLCSSFYVSLRGKIHILGSLREWDVSVSQT